MYQNERKNVNIIYSTYDLPESFVPSSYIAIDTEAMGLIYHRDRLCLVQLTNGDGDIYLIHFPTNDYKKSPKLVSLLTDANVTKIFHFARFDVGILQYSFNIVMKNIFCTKIASRLVRTYTNRHGLKDLCRDLLKIELSKEEQTSDWGAVELSKRQQEYAANDVVYLHQLQRVLESLLIRENRQIIAAECFKFLPTRAHLDIEAGESYDIFSHSS